MMKQNSSAILNATRLLGCLGLFSFFNAVEATICEPGYYAFSENGSDCRVCPPGTYSEVQGADFCKICLDTFYSGEGANSAELWNGELYCVHLGFLDDDFLNSSSGDTSESAVSTSPTSIQIAADAPSAVPSQVPSSKPSEKPSIMPALSNESLAPTTFSSLSDDDGVTRDEFESLNSCNDESVETDCFESHGRFQHCPATHEMILYPILVILFFVILIAFLEFILPMCFTIHIWWGLEYLQMLYLIGISSTSWSPAAGFLFGKIIPVFAIDFNSSFSLQCVIGENWPQQEAADPLLVLALPIIFLILSTFLSKISSNRIVRDESVSRWMALLLYVGYMKLVLSSLEALQLPTSWSAEPLSDWVNSDLFYSTLGGIAGLLFYGLTFPAWFLQGVYRYNVLTLALIEADVAQDTEQNNEGQLRDSKRKKYAKRKNQIFVTIGILPIHLRQTAWWWPGIWMLRKFLMAIFCFFFPDEQFLFLVIFLVTNLLSVIIQHHFQPLGDEHCQTSDGSTKNWHSIATVDTVLQVSLAAMVGIVFFSSWPLDLDVSMRSVFQQRMQDALVLLVFTASSLYLAVTIGVRCTWSEPRFRYIVSQIIATKVSKNKNDNSDVNSTKIDSSITEPSEERSSLPTLSIEESSSHGPNKEIEFFAAGKDSAWSCQDSSPADEEYGYGSSGSSSPYLLPQDGDDENFRRNRHEKESIPSASRPKFARSDSTIATTEDDGGIEDDAQTLCEEVWVDEETGEEIVDPERGNWMDAETGLPAVHSSDLEDPNTETNNICD